MKTENKTAIIVGATSGMGRGVALALLEKGYTIGIAGRRGEALLEIKRQAPDRVFTKEIDVCTPDAPTLLHKLIDETGGMDLYFHSSGYGKANIELDTDIERQTALTNCYGFTQMVDTAFNYFRTTRRSGHIAFISSIAGTKGLGAAPSYSASKRYQWTYAEALSQQAHMEHLDIRFTDIRPGFVATDFIKGSPFPMQLSTDYAVRLIVDALEKRKRKATIDWKYRLLCHAWRLIPASLWERFAVRA